MTPQEIHEALTALAAEIGPQAHLSVSVGVSKYSNGLNGSIYPNGISSSSVNLHTRKAETWEGVIEEMRAAWEQHRDLHASNTIKGMALAIIRLTAEHGECTDQALRVEFGQQEIDLYGEQSAELATEMGGNGPFKIIATGQGNGPDDYAFSADF